MMLGQAHPARTNLDALKNTTPTASAAGQGTQLWITTSGRRHARVAMLDCATTSG
jgi:hypothetical protein